jgi:hypothetical protein
MAVGRSRPQGSHWSRSPKQSMLSLMPRGGESTWTLHEARAE